MAGHGPGVAQGKVCEGVAIEVNDVGAVRLSETQGEAAGPLVHPGHGNAGKEVISPFVEGFAGRMARFVEGVLLRHEG